MTEIEYLTATGPRPTQRPDLETPLTWLEGDRRPIADAWRRLTADQYQPDERDPENTR